MTVAPISWRRWALLGVGAIIAGAGIAYELSLMLLGTVTVGSTERANAIVVGTTMFGMGLGAAFGGRWCRRPVAGFVRVEVVLAILGAAATPTLYWVWAQLDALWGPLLAVSLMIGVCIGMEMPILAALNDRLAKQDATTVVSHFTAADYFGALGGAIAFAFLIRPTFGIVNGTILVACINVSAAALVPLIVREAPDERGRLPPWSAIPVGVAALALCAVQANAIVDDGRQAAFRDPIVATAESPVQEIVVTSRVHPGGVVDTRLFLDGDLQLSSVDEHRYHEALVHPVLSAVDSPRDVLILGGGDCLAAREVLRRPGVERVTLIELDPTVTELMRSVDELAALPDGACDDPRLDVVNDDAFTWVVDAARDEPRFDAVIVDFPDPDTPALGRLYSVELYQHLRSTVRPGAAMAVQCGSPFFAPEAYWTCADTLEAAGFDVLSYHVDVPSFGDWGFHLAAATLPTPDSMDIVVPGEARFLTPAVFDAATVFPTDVQRDRFDTRPSTILDPAIVEAAQGAWIGYD